MAAIAATPFLCCNSCKFLLHPFYHLYNINNSLFSRKICKTNPSFLTSTPIRCIQSTQQSLETRNQDMGFGHRPNVVNILEERGLLESLTSENLRSVCSDSNQTKLKVYCGFDPTAESLHLGNLLGIIVLSWFQRCGHNVVALIGGATARVGDPSGKSIERPELDVETLDKNAKGIGHTLSTILDRKWEQNTNSKVGSQENSISNLGTEQNSFSILNNLDWWKDVKLLDFLRQVGRFARVGTMMAKESVKRRVESEQGMSYTEFTYQLLQGYDFLYLFENKEVNVQIGGSDQWGNITAGTELVRKILQVEGAYGLTFPLLLKSDGAKFGKSEDGAIWLSSSMLSPYKFYQYFFSIPDVDVVRFIKILTFLSMEEINALEEQMNMPGYVPNSVQRRLAEEVTRFVHGENGLSEALKATEALRPGTETKLDWKTIERIAEDVPSCSLSYDQILNASLVDLSVSTGLLDSKSAARRLLKQGGLYLNNERVAGEGRRIEAADIVEGKVLLLSAGKKNKMVVLSFDSTCTIEETIKNPEQDFCISMVYQRRDISAHQVKWAERNGFKAVVLTVDNPRLGRTEVDIRNSYQSYRAGISGIAVSNHGGCQLDYVPPTISVLEEVVQAVGGRVPVLFDRGIRRGTDVFKLLAFGAEAVLIGRSVIYGLAEKWEHGVRRVIEMLRDELELTMALCGCCSINIIEKLCTDRQSVTG